MSTRYRSQALVVGSGLLAALWLVSLLAVWKEFGFFNWIGVDYALYVSGARILQAEPPERLYDLDLSSVRDELGPFGRFYRANTGELRVGPVPHLPPTLFLYAPFAKFSPAWGYGLWVAANILLAFAVIRCLALRFPSDCQWAVTAIALTFFPLIYGLFMGQPVVILLLAFYRAYRAWEEGQDFQAGVWSGLLVLKVQYLPFVALVLAYKRRWASLAGMASSLLVIFLISFAVLGTRGFASYAQTLGSLSCFRIGHFMICPEQMINWRAVLVNTLPTAVSEAQGKTITLLLSAMTTASLLWIWRGPWKPRDPRFSLQMLAAVLATMLGTYHNHIHGATLLLVPAIVLMSRGGGPHPIPLLLLLGLIAPTIDFTLFRHTERSAMLLFGLMVTALLTILLTDEAERGKESGIERPGHPAGSLA